jgi:hypothetical protein
LGDIESLKANRFAWRYIRDYLHPAIETDKLTVSFTDDEVVPVLSNIRAMLRKYGFEEMQSKDIRESVAQFLRGGTEIR